MPSSWCTIVDCGDPTARYVGSTMCVDFCGSITLPDVTTITSLDLHRMATCTKRKSVHVCCIGMDTDYFMPVDIGQIHAQLSVHVTVCSNQQTN